MPATTSNSRPVPLPSGVSLARGRYRIEAVVGQGGFGYVYLARDPQGQAVAVKQGFDLSSEGVMQFGHEVAVQKFLTDATFVRVFAQFVEKIAPAGALTASESLFTVMEFVPGHSLEELLEERLQLGQGPFPERDGVAWATQLLSALEHAHAVGVIHRDIKPSNILLLPDGVNIKVIDFGIAKIGGTGAQTLQGARGVSPGYSPPEQYAQTGQTDTYSDIYAVGATLYHLVTGHAPVDAPMRLSGQPLLPPRQHNPALSPLVEDVILQAMALQVADRYQDAVEMLTALRGKSTRTRPVSSTQHSGTAAPVQAWASPVRPAPAARHPAPKPSRQAKPRRRPALPLVLAGMAIGAAVGIVLAVGNATPSWAALAQVLTPLRAVAGSPSSPAGTVSAAVLNALAPLGLAPAATPTPTPTRTPVPTFTATATPTGTPTVAPSVTPTVTSRETPTLRPTASPTRTPRPTVTPTASPTPNLVATATALQRQVAVAVAATLTAQPTATPQPTPTPVQMTTLPPLDSTGAQLPAMVGLVDGGAEGDAGLVNLRTGPSTDYPVLMGVATGAEVLILGRNQAADWLRVRTADGTLGWMSAQYVATPQPPDRYPVLE